MGRVRCSREACIATSSRAMPCSNRKRAPASTSGWPISTASPASDGGEGTPGFGEGGIRTLERRPHAALPRGDPDFENRFARCASFTDEPLEGSRSVTEFGEGGIRTLERRPHAALPRGDPDFENRFARCASFTDEPLEGSRSVYEFGEGGIRTLERLITSARFPSEYIQPLCHLSQSQGRGSRAALSCGSLGYAPRFGRRGARRGAPRRCRTLQRRASPRRKLADERSEQSDLELELRNGEHRPGLVSMRRR